MFVLDSMIFLFKTLDLNSDFDIDIIDEYENDKSDTTPFPITFDVDYENEIVYFICIDKTYLK